MFKKNNPGCNCCCNPPVISCVPFIESGVQKLNYTIKGATSAYFVKTCYDDSDPPVGTTTNLFLVPPVSGIINVDLNCEYILRATNVCGTSEKQCKTGTCFPCPVGHADRDKPFKRGLLVISEVPNTITSTCPTGFGYSNNTWDGYGLINGVYFWNTATSFTLPIGTATWQVPIYIPFTNTISGYNTYNINYGIRFQCVRADIVVISQDSPFGDIGISPVNDNNIDPATDPYCLENIRTPNLASNLTYQRILACTSTGNTVGPQTYLYPFTLGTVHYWIGA